MAGENDVRRRIIDLIDSVGEDINQPGSLQLNVSLNLYLWKRLVRTREFLETEWVRGASRGITMPLTALHRAVMDANALVQECCSFQWIPAAIQQAENKEAFFEVVKDLYWCTDVTLKALRDSGLDCRALQVEHAPAADELIRNQIDAAATIDRKALESRLDEFISNPQVDEANYLLRPEHLAIATHLKSWFWLENPDIRTRLRNFFHALWVGRKLPHWDLLRDAYNLYMSSSWPLPTYSIVGDRTNVGKFRGHGVLGRVYECEWQGHLFAEKNVNNGHSKVFQQEAAVMRDIRHPNVVKLIAQDDARCKLLLELMNGSLHDLINERAPFPLAVIVDILLQISKAFLFLHKKRVAHRDIKPGNILYNVIRGSEPESSDFQIKVADFGLAKVKFMSAMGMTVDQGTTAYTSPELMRRDGDYNTKVLVKHSLVSADVYGFGITCFVVAVGTTSPYGDPSPDRLAFRVKEGLRPSIPDDVIVRDELAYLMRICWSEDPLKRPPFTYIYKFLRDFKASLLTDPDSTFVYEEWDAYASRLGSNALTQLQYEEWSADGSRWSARWSNIMNGMARASGIVWTLLSVALVWALRLVKLLFTRRFKSLEEITARDVRSRQIPYELLERNNCTQVNQVEITMTPTSARSESAFLRGAYFLTQLAPHPNLPTVVGYSVHQNYFYLLHKADSVRGVNSLHDIMDLSGTGDWQVRHPLTWPERYNVALGVGQALAFLHQQRVPIVHGNLSSKNIMLQKECNYAPKLFNFYTSCMFPPDLEVPSTLHTNDTRAWLPEAPEAPEANDHRGDNTAFAVDVYSYGVLLLVLVANKNVYTTSTVGTARGEQVHIVHEAIEYFRFELRRFEANLRGSDPDVVYRVLRLALHCVQPNPRDRPSMTAALDMLTGKEELNDTGLVTYQRHNQAPSN